MASNSLTDTSLSVSRQLRQRFLESKTSLQEAEAALKDIPRGMLGNGAAGAQGAILELLDRAGNHYIAAEKSIIEKYGDHERS